MNPHNTHLLMVSLSAVVVLIVMIAWFKVHPFLSLVIVSIALGLAVGMPIQNVVHSFETGVGTTLGHIAVVVALGSILGKMMAESGGADSIAQTLIRLFGPQRIAWAMLLIGLVIGMPVFFEVGFVLLIPIAFTVARRTGKSLVLVALPLLAGLSVVHAFIPPHPAAMAAVIIFHAETGRTIFYALLVGIPAAILAGPLYATWIAPRISLPEHNPVGDLLLERDREKALPSFALTLATILLPVLLMLAGGWADRLARPGTGFNNIIRLLGTPAMALLAGVLVSMITFGWMQGISRSRMLAMASESLPPAAGAILLIGAGGGFGRILQDSSISTALIELSQHLHLSVLLLAWILAALFRVATGSSTVAMTTAAGVIAPLALQTPGLRPELLVIATGAGSIILSHFNDGGFWLVKEYLNMSVRQTFKSWTVCETILSVTGLLFVLGIASLA